MKLGIMQPYFLPYIGYISLIKQVDEFIFLDIVQFIRHGWIARNRILKQNKGWQYINVPLQKHKREIIIKDIKIKNTENWQNKIFAQLKHYQKKAPFYDETLEVLKAGLAEKTESITRLNYNILKEVIAYLNFPFRCSIFSERNLVIEPITAPDEWALNICKALGYNEYWNPPGGGQALFNISKYEKAGIKLIFQRPILKFYSQNGVSDVFEPGLSIIDVMMFNPVDQINKMLDDFELI
jgi:hypothetical protein